MNIELSEILPLLIPLIVVQIGLQIYAGIDLYRREEVKGPKWAWALVILLGQLIGPVVYLLVARKEE